MMKYSNIFKYSIIVFIVSFVFLGGFVTANVMGLLSAGYRFTTTRNEGENPVGPNFQRVSFKPVLLDKSNLEKKRLALERKLFGGRREHRKSSGIDIDSARLKSFYSGDEVFSEYYEKILGDGSVILQEIRGTFEEIDGFVWKSLFFKHETNGNNKLFIYQHGHLSNSFAIDYANILISRMILQGYDVIILSMPGFGWNEIGNVRIKTWDGWGYILNDTYYELASWSFLSLRTKRHELFEMIDTGGGHFIKFFVEPVSISIDHAVQAKDYKKILMAGISGGGWTTTVVAALDERIDYSLSFAGTLPFSARHRASALGDSEQLDHAFYREFPYTLLYELASASLNKKRVHYQIFNTDDPCCFAKSSAVDLERYQNARRPSPEWDFRIEYVDSNKHEIVPQNFFDILKRLETEDAS